MAIGSLLDIVRIGCQTLIYQNCTPSLKYPTLYQFFSCYFHQDWIDEFESPEVAVEAYINSETQETKSLACIELDTIIKSNSDEEELGRLLEKLGCFYDPHAEDLLIANWLKLIRANF